MISVLMKTPYEMLLHIAKQAKARRLFLNLSQATLAAKSGVSYGTLKKFERTGQISFASLLKLALALDCLENFMDLFPFSQATNTIDDLIQEELTQDKKRKRGRK